MSHEVLSADLSASKILIIRKLSTKTDSLIITIVIIVLKALFDNRVETVQLENVQHISRPLVRETVRNAFTTN